MFSVVERDADAGGDGAYGQGDPGCYEHVVVAPEVAAAEEFAVDAQAHEC